MKLNDLISHLAQPYLRSRTGLWMVADYWVGREDEYLGRIENRADLVDLRQIAIRSRPEGAMSAGISTERIVQWIDEVLEKEGFFGCVVLTHLDLFLAKLSEGDRTNVIKALRGLPHRNRSLIIALPKTNLGTLVDPRDLEDWRLNKRLAEE